MKEDNEGGVRVEREVRAVTCAGKHGHDPQILDCPKCVEEDRDRYRMVLDLIIRRNKLMNPEICLDMLDKAAKKALGYA